MKCIDCKKHFEKETHKNLRKHTIIEVDTHVG